MFPKTMRLLCALTLLCGLSLAAHAQRATPISQGLQNPLGSAWYGGVLYVANGQSDSIKRIGDNGTAITIAALAPSPQAIAFDKAGNLYVASAPSTGGSILLFTRHTNGTYGTGTVLATGFARPQALQFNAAGTLLYVADQITGTLSTVTISGKVTVLASGFSMPSALALDSEGRIYIANALNGTISRVTQTGAVSIFASNLYEPYGLAFGESGNLYVAERAAGRITRISAAGAASVFLAGTSPSFTPQGLSLGPDGNIYMSSGLQLPASQKTFTGLAAAQFTGSQGAIWRITPGAAYTAYAPALGVPSSLALAPSGMMYVLSSRTNCVYAITPSEAKINVFASGFAAAQSVVTDAQSNIYVSDSSAGTITKFSPTGTKSIFASGLPGANGMGFDSNGNLYVAASTGTGTPNSMVTKITPAGETSMISAFSGTASAVAVRKDNTVFVFVQGAQGMYGNATIYSINQDGSLSEFGVGLDTGSTGMAFDAAGNLIIAGWGTSITVQQGLFEVAARGNIAATPILTGAYAGLAINAQGNYVTGGLLDNSVLSINPTLPTSYFTQTAADDQDAYVNDSVAGSYDNQSWQLPAGFNAICPVPKTFPTEHSVSQWQPLCTKPALNIADSATRTDLGLDSYGALPPVGPPDPIVGNNGFVQSYSSGGTWFSTVNSVQNNLAPPTASPHILATEINTPVTINLATGSTGNPPNALIFGQPSNGKVVGTPSTKITFTPAANFKGVGSFNYYLTSNQGTSLLASAYIAIGITPPAQPKITALSSSFSAPEGGMSLTITGKNFTTPLSVRVGLTPASVTISTPTSITITVPQAPTPYTLPLVENVTVSNAGGTSPTTSADQLTYTDNASQAP